MRGTWIYSTVKSCRASINAILKRACRPIDEADSSVDKILHNSRRVQPVDRIGDDQQIGFLPLGEKFPELVILDDTLLQLPAAATATTMPYGIIGNPDEFRLAQIAQGTEAGVRCQPRVTSSAICLAVSSAPRPSSSGVVQ